MPKVTGKNAKLIFRHHLASSSDYFTSESEFLSTNSPNKFSILGEIQRNQEYYKSNGYFEFILEYPELKGCNHWLQKVFPTLAAANEDNGFFDLGSSYPNNGWHGLQKSSSTNTFLDGSPYSKYWYHPIGQKYEYAGNACLPHPNDDGSNSSSRNCIYDTSLFIVIPNKRIFTCKRRVYLASINQLAIMIVLLIV